MIDRNLVNNDKMPWQRFGLTRALQLGYVCFRYFNPLLHQVLEKYNISHTWQVIPNIDGHLGSTGKKTLCMELRLFLEIAFVLFHHIQTSFLNLCIFFVNHVARGAACRGRRRVDVPFVKRRRRRKKARFFSNIKMFDPAAWAVNRASGRNEGILEGQMFEFGVSTSKYSLQL